MSYEYAERDEEAQPTFVPPDWARKRQDQMFTWPKTNSMEDWRAMCYFTGYRCSVPPRMIDNDP